MPQPERRSDRWVSVAQSVVLHGALIGVLAYGWWTFRHPPPPAPTLALDATVVSAKALNGIGTLPAPPAVAPTPAKTIPPVENVVTSESNVEPPAPKPNPTPPPIPPANDDQTVPPPPELTERKAATQQQAEKKQHEKAVQEAQAEQERKADAAKKTAAAKAEAEAATVAKNKHRSEVKAAAKTKALAEAKKRAAEQARLAEAKRKAQAQRKLEEQLNAEQAHRVAEAKALAMNQTDLAASVAAEEKDLSTRSGPAMASWVQQITARIEHAWIRPPSAKTGVDCTIDVTQVPGGEIVNVKVGACNGDGAVVQSIQDAAYRASPLPAPPDPALFERNLEITFKPD
ncbi:MAG: cell envelope integrity protein TolA [Steroidobacteraceae bacterium]